MIVIGYLLNEKKRFRTYVANHVRKFRDMAGKETIKHVRTTENPADDASRGISVREVEKVDRWFYGPSFLRGKEEEFLADTPSTDIADDDPEVILETKSNVALVNKVSEVPGILEFLGTRVSNWSRMKGIVASISLFVDKLRKKKSRESTVLVEDLVAAERLIINPIQNRYFQRDIASLEGRKQVPKSSSIAKLNPFIDEQGIMRVGGRLKNSELSEELKHPIILPKKERIVTRIIEW